uniref:Glycerol-3-phosphate dehydrogenase [NAD(+)] n=2 Tax=Canis lupus familiaris TaxID=9615 RepID=A0A8P0PR79_CANLF
MAAAPLKVCIVGSGNWGSAVAKIIGNNVKKLTKFASTVKMWVFEETVNGRKLTDIINNDHENVKYLPGHKLPENVIAVPNLGEAVKDADLLVFVIPHQFIHRICDELTGRVPKDALGITLIKGIDEGPEGLKLISDIIREKMGIDVSVLMGANIASEVAAEKFCETTIGSKIMENGLLFKELLQTPNFRITVVDDADTVELCGALKNIVAVGAGFCDGLHSGDNTKAAVIRLGLMEMIAFARIFCKGQVSTATFLESCGVADLITTCYGGRNRRIRSAMKANPFKRCCLVSRATQSMYKVAGAACWGTRCLSDQSFPFRWKQTGQHNVRLTIISSWVRMNFYQFIFELQEAVH